LALSEAREALETTGARLAANRASADDVSRLEKMLETSRNEVESSGLKAYPQDLDFHREILAIARTPHIQRLHENVAIRLRIARLRSARNPSRASEALEEHHAILVAIGSGDDEAAEAVMRLHLQRGVRAVLEMSRQP
jgi:DNA-binding GntR family transcriptional regulator